MFLRWSVMRGKIGLIRKRTERYSRKNSGAAETLNSPQRLFAKTRRGDSRIAPTRQKIMLLCDFPLPPSGREVAFAQAKDGRRMRAEWRLCLFQGCRDSVDRPSGTPVQKPTAKRYRIHFGFCASFFIKLFTFSLFCVILKLPNKFHKQS